MVKIHLLEKKIIINKIYYRISYHDLMLHFGNVDTVHLTADSYSTSAIAVKPLMKILFYKFYFKSIKPTHGHWYSKTFKSRWQSGLFKSCTAGGVESTFLYY